MTIRDASGMPAPGRPETPTCPVCRAPETRGYAPGRDRLFGLSRGVFPLYRCAGCGCVFQHPMPQASALPELYPRGYWWSATPGAGSGVASLIRRMEKAYRECVVAGHVRFLESCARQSGSAGKLLLDIGCGSGTFLKAARSRGFIAHGMDISNKAVEEAQKQYGLTVRRGGIGEAVWGDLRFDFITMFHVLEHLPDPRNGLRYAAGLLRPQGILLLQVPNVSSIQAGLFRGRWYGLDAPRHVINLSPRALSLLLEETGYAFRLVRRFSLRDNPASIASSLAPRLDPIGRAVRNPDSSPWLGGLVRFAYLSLFLLAVFPAFAESILGRGGTLWACARPAGDKG